MRTSDHKRLPFWISGGSGPQKDVAGTKSGNLQWADRFSGFAIQSISAIRNYSLITEKCFRFQCGVQTTEDRHGWFPAPPDQGRCYEVVPAEGLYHRFNVLLWWKADSLIHISADLTWCGFLFLWNTFRIMFHHSFILGMWNSVLRALHSDYFPETIMGIFCHVLFQTYFHIWFCYVPPSPVHPYLQRKEDMV